VRPDRHTVARGEEAPLSGVCRLPGKGNRAVRLLSVPRARGKLKPLFLVRALKFPLVLFAPILLGAAPQKREPGLLNPDRRVQQVRADTRTIKLPVIEGKEIRFSRLSGSQGLSQVRVSQIIQDDQGFIWFGTQDGLNRYDGYNFKVFKHETGHTESLSGVYIYSLFKDRSGAIWVGSDQFLDRFDPVTETFTHYQIDVEDSKGLATAVNQISQDGSGMLWLSTGRGLYKLDPVSGRIIHFRHDPNDPSSLGDNDIKTTGEDRAGNFWVATSQTLDEFDRLNGTVKKHVLIGESGMGGWFHEDRFGVFWLIYGSDGSIATFDRKTNKLIRYELVPEHRSDKLRNPAYTMLEDHDGTMWFGTGATGLLKFDREHRRFISYNNRPGDSESLADTRVITLFEDREENIWLGLHQAEPNFFASKPPPFERFTHGTGNPNSLGEALIGALYEDRQGVLWVATDRLVKRIVRTTGQYSTFNQLSGTEVLSIIEEGPDTLWFGTAGEGLKRYDRRTGQFKTYRHNPADPSSLCSDVVERLLIDRRGTLWAATWDGLSRFDTSTQHFTTYKPDLKSRGLNYFAIAEAGNGKLWLGSNLGLLRFDPITGEFTVYHHDLDDPKSLSENRVNSVFFDHLGTMWVGTQNGLNKFDPRANAFAVYGERHGMAGNVVSCVLEDKRGLLWMSTNKGVSSFDPRIERFNNYTTADGLPGPDLTGWGACYKSLAGEMFFGGFSGATAFFPEKIADNLFVPPIVLTDFRLFGIPADSKRGSPLTKSINSTDTITLSHEQNVFAIEFSALRYFNAATSRYRYMLEGLDHQWNEVGSDQRLASYTTLPAGTYTFHVQGAAGRGAWSEPGVQLRIVILPPWWSTSWFRTSYILALLLTLFFVYYYRLGRIRRQFELRLEERVNERTRIARELHDTLLQSLHGLILRFQAATNLLPECPEEARKTLESAIDQAAEAITESRDAVQGLRSSKVVTDDIAFAINTLGEELAAGETNPNAAEFHVDVEGTARSLHPIWRDEVYRIAGEALRNALKHAQAKRIEVEIQYDERRFQLRVRDDGKGIDPQMLNDDGRTGHYGLPGMRERARLLGARLTVWSERDSGTEVELTIPATTAYATAPTRSRRSWLGEKLAGKDAEIKR
jgi:signal transduction histidine kinase/ligand-binding sensor domain-containing protein